MAAATRNAMRSSRRGDLEAWVGSGDATLDSGTISGEPCAANPAKHGRVQDASKGLDREQIWSREPGYGKDVHAPVQTVPAPGARQRSAHVSVHGGIAGLAQRLAGELVEQEERPD